MKSLMILGCAAAAALFLTADTASAQCGYGGGGGYYGGGYGGSGLSIGYSSYAPRTSFNVGYNSYAPRYNSYVPQRTAYRSAGHYDYHPTEVYRHGNHLHVQPSHYDYHRGGRHW
jgi:hypothetical protein